MADTLRLCLVQMCSTNHHRGNIEFVEATVETAAKAGADLVALPEAAGMMNRNRDEAQQLVVAKQDDPFIMTCRALARQHQIWIHTGSTPVRGTGGKFLNHSSLIAPDGQIVAEYDKIHLFDVFLEGRAPTGESNRYDPGGEAVLAELPWGKVGLSICYDVRFPHLYRQIAKSGARLLFVPSAFTVPTGKAHWEVLLRARAIENGAWVVAAAQVGHHDDGRQTWGHSMVVDPWGNVVSDIGGTEPGTKVMDIDLSQSDAARRQIPSLVNERPYTLRQYGVWTPSEDQNT